MNKPSPAASTRNRTRVWRSCCAIALTWMLLTSALSSCATGTAISRVPAPVPPPPPPAVPASLRQVPPPLPLATDARLTTLLRNQEQVGQACSECRAAQANLVQALAEYEATAWAWYCKAVAAIKAQAEGCPPAGRGEGPDG